MICRIVFSRAAEKDLRKIVDRTTLRRLAGAIEYLAGDLYPAGARKVGGVGAVWRIRVGGWRICYTVEAGELVILILTISRRGDVYDRLRRRLGCGGHPCSPIIRGSSIGSSYSKVDDRTRFPHVDQTPTAASDHREVATRSGHRQLGRRSARDHGSGTKRGQ